MTYSANDLVTQAKKNIPAISPADARAEADAGSAILLDVREPAELTSDGKPANAVHVPRGLLEFKADPETGMSEPALTAARDAGKRIHVLCMAGGRAALAAQTLNSMGYDATVIDGGIKGWKEAGVALDGDS